MEDSELSDELDRFEESKERLTEIVDEMLEEQAYKDAAKLDYCPTDEIEYAKKLHGSLLVSNLGVVSLVTGFHASARHGSAENIEQGKMRSEVVVEAEVLHAGDNPHVDEGQQNNWFIGKFENPIVLFGVPDAGAPIGEHGRFNLRSGKWQLTDDGERIRERWKAGEFDREIDAI